MRSILLVRHAHTKPVDGLPAHEWGLTREGLQAAMELGDALPLTVQTIMSGTAVPAVQTARAIASAHGGAREVVLDDALDEVARPADRDPDDHDLVLRYLDGEAIDGWEAQDVVVARADRALRNARHESMQAQVLVTHGLLMSLWLAPRIGTRPSTVWRGLRAPDVWRYDVRANQVARFDH